MLNLPAGPGTIAASDPTSLRGLLGQRHRSELERPDGILDSLNAFVTLRRIGLALLAGGILLGWVSLGFAQEPDTAARIREASRVFVASPDPSVTSAQIRQSLLALLDIIAAVCPELPYQAEIRNRLGIARELMETDSLFNDKARQYLSFAYRMMTDGRKYAPPSELDQFVTPAEAQEKARAHATRLVDKAVGELNAGRPAETARLLLELVLMIVTPVKG
jgi:hypothetical protein